MKAVDGVSYSLEAGETLGIVGESGSGKSVSSLTVMGLITPKQANITGEVFFQGQDLLKVPKDEMRTIRGAKISMIFQDPMTSLHPFYKVGYQIAEAILEHQDISKKEAFDQAVEMLARVNIPHPKDRASQYPHEFSGGMRQRAMIAMALSLNPDVLIADEPTTALDVTVQAQILDLIDRLKSEFNAAVIIITHDLGVVAEHCDNIMVMYAGKAAEYGNTDDIYYKPLHPYTWGLLSSIPRLDDEKKERLNPIRGLPPSLIQVPPGCAFHPRCPYKFDPCDRDVPELLPVDGHHAAACHLSLADKEKIRDEEVLAPPMSVQAERASGPTPGAGRRAPREARRDQEVLPDHAGDPVPTPRRQRARGRRRRSRDLPGPDGGTRRRDRLREVDPRPGRDAALRRHRGEDLVQRAATSRNLKGKELQELRRGHADGLPGPVRLAEPEEDGRVRSSASRSACTRRCRGTGSSPRSSSSWSSSG